MNEPTTMALAIQKAYCRQILAQVADSCHTLANLKEMAREHEQLCANEDGPNATLDDPYYLGLLAAIEALSVSPEGLVDLSEAIKLLFSPEQIMRRMRDRKQSGERM